MHKLIVVLVSFVDVEQVVERSFKMMNRDDELEFIGFVQEPDTLSDLILEVGFLGKKVVQDVKSAVEQEHEERAQRNLESIAEEGEKKERQVSTKLAEGSVDDLQGELAKEDGDYLIINYPRDEHCTGDVKPQSVEDILTEVKSPYEIYFDGKRAENRRMKVGV